MEHAGGGAHGVGAVEFDAGCGSAHGERGVAAEDGIFGVRHGDGIGEGLKVLGGVVVSGASDGDIFVGDSGDLLAKLLADDGFEGVEADAHHAEAGTHGKGILRDFVLGDVSQSGDGKRTKLHAVGGLAGLDGVGVVDARATGSEQAEVAVHRVLIERDEEFKGIAHVGDGINAGADGEKSVAAANDGLVRVVGVQVEAAAAEDLCQDVAWGGDTLAGGAADADGEGLTHSAPADFDEVRRGFLKSNQNTTAHGRFDRARRDALCLLPDGVEEELAIAFGAGDRGVDDFDVGGSGLSDTVPNAVDGELVGGGVTHDAAFADALAAGFRARPGFLALWYGGLRSERVRDVTRGTREAIAAAIERMLAVHWPAATAPDRVTAARMVVIAGDGLLREAFRTAPGGDPVVLAEGQAMLDAYVAARLGGPRA